MNQEEFKKEMDFLEQRAVRAERLSRVISVLTVLLLIVVVSFGVLAFVFSQHFTQLIIASMICSFPLSLCFLSQIHFTQEAQSFRMQKVIEAENALDELRREVAEKVRSNWSVEPCFAALGFTQRPTSEDEVKHQYRRLAKVLHPDAGGDAKDFIALKENYQECLRRI